MPSTTYATPAQLTYLSTLAAERPADHPLVTRAATVTTATPRRTASALIDALRGVRPAPTPDGAPLRPNRYGGPCILCTAWVPENTGGILRNAEGRYVTRHLDCATVTAPEGLDLAKLPEGRYGVPGGDTRLKVQVDRPSEGRWAGYVFIRDAAVYGQGRRYGSQRPGRLYEGDITDELRAILADVPAARARYGALTNQCSRCNRPLEDSDSVARGLGPYCVTQV